MYKVGYIANDIYEVCSPDRMIQFFCYVKKIKMDNNIFDANGLISDRLYKRYITMEQNEDLRSDLMYLKTQHLSDTYGVIVNKLMDAINGAEHFYNYFKTYKTRYNQNYKLQYTPIRIGITEITSFEDQFRDLSEYDNLQGPPFWLREYLQEYPDTVLPFE